MNAEMENAVVSSVNETLPFTVETDISHHTIAAT